MIIPITKLPSNFKPYPFKSFKMHAINLQQALDLGDNPSISEIAELIQKLTDDTIDASLLTPIDLKYLIAMLSFHAYPKKSWTLDVVCPHCNSNVKQQITANDFPPIPSLTDDDAYPLNIDDGTHVYELGYPSLKSISTLIDKMSNKTEPGSLVDYLDTVEPYILSIDGNTENIRTKLLSIEDLGVLHLMLETINKFFADDTYGEFKCPHCSKSYKIPLSALEVTQYTPFLNTPETSKYKTNFRL